MYASMMTSNVAIRRLALNAINRHWSVRARSTVHPVQPVVARDPESLLGRDVNGIDDDLVDANARLQQPDFLRIARSRPN